ncbi:unnamed protein product [Orchesella dallaii]|uniref:Uncharacterized protein n=1 Tax=Orchesella dallaii TaxID=48710 RepID=A0ABP1S4C2_9HEXA
MVAVFKFIDWYWEEAEIIIPLPGYGEESCFPKRSGAARLYIFVPLGAALAINSFVGTWIVVKLLKSKKEAKWLNANSPERYTDRFFLKLFCITGIIAWLPALVRTLQQFSDKNSKNEICRQDDIPFYCKGRDAVNDTVTEFQRRSVYLKENPNE